MPGSAAPADARAARGPGVQTSDGLVITTIEDPRPDEYSAWFAGWCTCGESLGAAYALIAIEEDQYSGDDQVQYGDIFDHVMRDAENDHSAADQVLTALRDHLVKNDAELQEVERVRLGRDARRLLAAQ